MFCGFGGFGCFCLLFLVVFGRAPLGHPLQFPLISIKVANVFGSFGCFCFMVFVVFGRSSGARPTISFAVHQICSFLVIYSRGEPKGKVLSARPRHRLEKQHRDSHLSRPRGLIAFKVYPFAPGEYQKARFYPLSPGTGGRLSCDPFGPAPGPNCL